MQVSPQNILHLYIHFNLPAKRFPETKIINPCKYIIYTTTYILIKLICIVANAAAIGKSLCRPYLCMIYCPFGAAKDENGCATCACSK